MLLITLYERGKEMDRSTELLLIFIISFSVTFTVIFTAIYFSVLRSK